MPVVREACIYISRCIGAVPGICPRIDSHWLSVLAPAVLLSLFSTLSIDSD